MYRALAGSKVPLTVAELVRAQNRGTLALVERKLAALGHDFELHTTIGSDGILRYQLGAFKGFVGQEDHSRHEYVAKFRQRVS